MEGENISMKQKKTYWKEEFQEEKMIRLLLSDMRIKQQIEDLPIYNID